MPEAGFRSPRAKHQQPEASVDRRWGKTAGPEDRGVRSQAALGQPLPRPQEGRLKTQTQSTLGAVGSTPADSHVTLLGFRPACLLLPPIGYFPAPGLGICYSSRRGPPLFNLFIISLFGVLLMLDFILSSSLKTMSRAQPSLHVAAGRRRPLSTPLVLFTPLSCQIRKVCQLWDGSVQVSSGPAFPVFK